MNTRPSAAAKKPFKNGVHVRVKNDHAQHGRVTGCYKARQGWKVLISMSRYSDDVEYDDYQVESVKP